MSGIGIILIGLSIATTCLVLASVWFLTDTDKRTAVLASGATLLAAALVVSFIDIRPPVIRQRENTFSYTAKPGLGSIISCYDNSDSTPKLSFVSASPETCTYDKQTDCFTFPELGKYMLTFRAADKNGNVRTKTLAVHIVDDIPPEITLFKKAVAMRVQQEALPSEQPETEPTDLGEEEDTSAITSINNYTDRIATAYDEIDGDVSATISIDETSINYTVAGQYNAAVTARDTSDNIAQAVVKVIIREPEAVTPQPETRPKTTP